MLEFILNFCEMLEKIAQLKSGKHLSELQWALWKARCSQRVGTPAAY